MTGLGYEARAVKEGRGNMEGKRDVMLQACKFALGTGNMRLLFAAAQWDLSLQRTLHRVFVEKKKKRIPAAQNLFSTIY